MSDEPEDETGRPNAADPVQLKRAQRRRDRQERESAAFWQALFADAAGRREMWAILDAAHTFKERFGVGPNGAPQAEASWFYAGEQQMGLRLFRSWLIAAPQGVLLMLQENDPRIAATFKS